MCVLAACGLLLLRGADADGAAGGEVPGVGAPDVLLAEVQQLRAAAEVGAMERDVVLDGLAQQVLAEVLRRQCVCVAAAVAAVVGSDDGPTGGQAVALGWSLDAPGAVRAAGGTAGHAGVIADARWSRVGLATRSVPDDVVWLVPAVGTVAGTGTDADMVNLAGYTLAVLVTQTDAVAGGDGTDSE